MTMNCKIVVPLLCCLLVAAPAGAQLCNRGITVRVSPTGFAFVVEEVRGLIPDTFSIPAISTVVVDWPLTRDDARVELGPTPDAAALRGMDFVIVDSGALRMRIALDINIVGPATISNAYAGFGTERCQLELRMPNVQFEADFALETYGNRIGVQLSETRVTANEQQRVVRVSDCAIGDIYNSLAQTLGQETAVGTQQWLEDFARTRVPPLLEQALMQSIEGSVPESPLRFSGQLREARNDSGGMLLSADISVEPLNQGFASCLQVRAPPLVPSCDRAAPAPPLSDAMYAVSFSEGLVNRALHATWRSGLLCIDSSELGIPELAETIEELSATLGLAAGSRVGFKVTPRKPPWVHFSQRDGARLMVEDLELQLELDSSDGRSGDLEVTASFSVAASPTLDPATNSLSLTLGAVGIRKVELGHGGGQAAVLQLDPARLQRFISDVALPLLRRQLELSQLTPSVVQAERYVLALRNVFVADGYVSLHGDAHRPSATTDFLPPDTRLLETPGALVGPQVLPLKVGGVDTQTPAELLRFQVRIDGGAWSEPRFGGLVDVVAHGGQHHVEVAAVDLHGNVDPSPLAFSLAVDSVPPEVRITQRPEVLIKEEPFSVGFIARDDQTAQGAIRFTVELIRVEDNGGSLETIDRRELPGGSTSARFEAQPNGLYRVRIIGHDQAGNVGSQDVGVVVEHAGCAAAGRFTPGSWAAWLLVALLCLRSRRRASDRRS